MNIRRICCT